MSNEEWEKKAEFIIEQQAQFASDIDQLKDIVARLANATLSRFEAVEQKTAERFGDVDAKIAALVDSQISTEESVRNLIAVVDRYFSEGRGGRSEG
ncbi:MAG: hypothetical protein LC800_05135 [Acidobacteria bacterium]|nr:hypothetical protein [Acidobacteriota bacterium]